MNDTERLEAMDSYFNRYRRLKSKLVQNEQDQEAVRAAYVKQRETLQESRARMTRELENMRKVMTKMIDDGSDPVMANLSIGDDKVTDLWNDQEDDTLTVDLSQLSGLFPPTSSSLTNTGIIATNTGITVPHTLSNTIGATGAVGANGTVGSISILSRADLTAQLNSIGAVLYTGAVGSTGSVYSAGSYSYTTASHTSTLVPAVQEYFRDGRAWESYNDWAED